MADSSMASPEQAASSRPRRPAPMTRQSSSQSHISQSPSEKGQHHRPQQHKVAHRHVAGGRMQRTLSTGKNLAKAAKATQHTQAQAQAPDEGGRHHRRSQSGTSISAPSSPRPGFKRNASSGAIMRHNPNAHAHVGLRKNHSSGHLVAKAKGGRSSRDLASLKGKLGNPSRSRPASPEERAVVHFDVGNDGGEGEGEGENDDDDNNNNDDNDNDNDDEGGWTEESASQSPTTTRSNTRSSSVATQAQRVVDDATESNTRANAGDVAPQTPAPATATATRLPTTHSRPPDADLITSRLLQRSASHTLVAPQPSSVSATVQSTAGRALQLSTSTSTSVGSTLIDAPGRHLVSRFMDGDGSAGTPRDGNYMSARRNQSTPSLDPADDRHRDRDRHTHTPAPTRPQSLKSGATTPNLFPPVTNRTQNKLLLQRAASAIEPHAPVPAILRTGGPSFHNLGLSYPGEGRIDPRLQQQFNHVAIEYSVVQRYRNPLADSTLRIQQMPGMLRKLRATKPGSANGSSLGTTTLSSSIHETALDTDGAGSRRRADSELAELDERDRERGRDRDRDRDRDSLEGERPRNEAEELCRRMWDSAEIVGGD